jgi:hypothetical protein
MKYEISRESFKQRLDDRLNFVFVDLTSAGHASVKFENVVHLTYGPQFKSEFAAQYPNKVQNVMLFSLQKGDEAPIQAADELEALGYNFIYFYRGTPDDVVLDKGLN